MKRKSIFIFIVFSLAMLIVPPGRFVYGFTLVLELNLTVLFGTLCDYLINKFELNRIRNIIILFVVIAFTVLFREIFILLYPEVMLVLGFVIYLIPVSFVTLYYLIDPPAKSLRENVLYNTKKTLLLSIYSLVFFLFRDIAGFGTFTFFGKNHQIYEKILFNYENFRVLTIFASVPGAFILSAVVCLCYLVIYNKIEIVMRKEDNK